MASAFQQNAFQIGAFQIQPTAILVNALLLTAQPQSVRLLRGHRLAIAAALFSILGQNIGFGRRIPRIRATAGGGLVVRATAGGGAPMRATVSGGRGIRVKPYGG
jgi:hypothetical protein